MQEKLTFLFSHKQLPFLLFFCPNLGHELFYPTLHAQKVEPSWLFSLLFLFLIVPLALLIHFERAMSASVAGGNCQTWHTAELLPFSKPSQVIDWGKINLQNQTTFGKICSWDLIPAKRNPEPGLSEKPGRNVSEKAAEKRRAIKSVVVNTVNDHGQARSVFVSNIQ